jgi:hypothetical protein
MPVDFLQKQEAGRTGPVTDGRSLGVPLGRGKWHPELNLLLIRCRLHKR